MVATMLPPFATGDACIVRIAGAWVHGVIDCVMVARSWADPVRVGYRVALLRADGTYTEPVDALPEDVRR